MEILIVSLIVIGDDGVQLNNKNLNFVNELQDAFRDDDHAVVFPNRGSTKNSITNNA